MYASLASRFSRGPFVNLRRPSASFETVALLLSAYFALACNHPFWTEAMAGREASQAATWLFAAAMLVALIGLHFLLLCLVPVRQVVKPLWSLLIVATAVATYYMNSYAIYLDPSMLRSVFATEAKESRDLLAGGLVLHVLMFAGLPLACVWSVRLRARRPLQALRVRVLAITGAAVIVSLAVLLSFQDLSSLMRNHREMRYLVTPANFLYSSARALARPAKAEGVPLIPVAPDAHLAAGWQARSKPVLFVMVLGETARAANWGLNGYTRQTTPRLAALDVINFSHVRSCGTDTETSVPCLFSAQGRQHYDVDRIRSSESLLHVLRRAGFNVVWRDNNTGCKGVCAGIVEERVDRQQDTRSCDADGTCLDGVLLHGLDTIARDNRGNLFVVLHQVGNHGPAYSRRYPAAFRRFGPACETVELRLCDRQEIVNAYDNALLYTDQVLADTIALLQGQEGRYDTAMLYVSDHGESLGENGLYLHGIPYPIAPDVQTQVPMVMWFSPGFLRSSQLDQGCLRRRALQQATHDDVFHSVLGLLQVETQVSDPAHDLSRECFVG